ncbi:MAG: hypothetical protein IT423_03220 [Pirellulaceae bacterium]|nr:hypothetical protein [Pirellulaceae bacterium]
MNHDIRRLKESTQFRILSRFPDSQRETARKLLGDFFILEDSSFLLARQRKREADALNAEQNEANAPIPPKKK